MEEYVYHTVDAGHIRNIGEQSVSNKIQAILELVKNAYDADSPDCVVTFHGKEEGARVEISKITIEDHGIGMTKSDLRDKFMKVGTGTKIEESLSPKLGRRVSGEKGMGHYSAQRLGDRITITTTPELFGERRFSGEDDATYVLELDWGRYVQGEDFGKIPNALRTVARLKSGTVIEISGLRDSWTTRGGGSDLETLAKNLGSVMLPEEMQSAVKDKFVARIKLEGFGAELPELQGTLLDHSPYKIEASLQNARIGFNMFSRKKANAPMHPINDGTIPAKDAICGDARITIYWFRGGVAKDLAVGAMGMRLLRERLGENYGIKIYNDGIRVMPYGEKWDDWLGLGARKSGPASGGMVRNVHLVGFIRLSRSNNPDIMETTTRQALRENPAFKSLKENFVIPVIEEMENAVRKIEREEGELAKKIHHANTARSEIEKLKQETQRLRVKHGVEINFIRGLSKVSRQIELQDKEHRKKEEGLLGSLEMYRNLSTVGIQTIAFNHEIIDPISLTKITLINLVSRHGGMTPEERQEDLNLCLDRITLSLNWAKHIKEFSSLLAGPGQAKKQRSVINIGDSLQKIKKGLSPVFSNLSISMRDPVMFGNVPDIVINKASFESIFINLISNSVRSLKRVERDRTIRVSVSKDDANILFEFEDNGHGIDDDVKGRIFRPFFTTYKNEVDQGTGMGLAIVREIVEDDYHGRVILAETVSENDCPGNGMARFLVRLPLDMVKGG